MEIRPDLAAAHARAWRRLAAPGTWWSGADRVAIAAEARAAATCRLCRARREALSPEGAAGTHDGPGRLPADVIDVVHRISTDPSRLSERWYRRMVGGHLPDTHYVELIGVIATAFAIDTFRHALGLDQWPLPAPEAGSPRRQRPAGAKSGGAWVPMIAPEDLTSDEPPIYQGKSAANIHRALSLVPEEVVGFFDLDDVMYMPDALLRDFGNEYRSISHAQIELLAARVSALNRCVY
jgi:hypothetical protein